MAIEINADLARKLIADQFPEYAHLPIDDVKQHGNDNRTYRLGDYLAIRMPIGADYAAQVPKEQELLPYLAKRVSFNLSTPIKMGKPSEDYPYPFSVYKWLGGKSINLLSLMDKEKERLALDLARFLKELQAINDVDGPAPGHHNHYRGDHIRVYDREAREQIADLSELIDSPSALALWDQACATKWHGKPVWIHGDLAIGNILVDEGKLSAIIDFGCTGIGDPSCDLVIAWTYLGGKSRDIFVNAMNMDADTWLRGRAWALWKATFELCKIVDKTSREAEVQQRIIQEVINR